jgi:hypothetical protein
MFNNLSLYGGGSEGGLPAGAEPPQGGQRKPPGWSEGGVPQGSCIYFYGGGSGGPLKAAVAANQNSRRGFGSCN